MSKEEERGEKRVGKAVPLLGVFIRIEREGERERTGGCINQSQTLVVSARSPVEVESAIGRRRSERKAEREQWDLCQRKRQRLRWARKPAGAPGV